MPLITRPDLANKLGASVVAQLGTSGYENVRGNLGRGTMSAESLSDAERKTFASDAQGIDSAIALAFNSDVLKQINVSAESRADANYVEMGITAAKMISKITDPTVYTSVAGKRAPSADSVVVSAESMGVVGVGDLTLSKEAYDGQNINNASYYSIMFNFSMIRQDEFSEAFFPTIVLDPQESGITVEVNVTSYMEEFVHALDGSASADKFRKAPIIKNIFSEKHLLTDSNKAVPVYRDNSASHFLAGYKFKDTTGAEEVETSPLLAGMTHNLISLSATDLLLTKGTPDQTDYLDRSVALRNVYLELTGKNGAGDTVTEVVSFDASVFPNGTFMPAQSGNTRSLVMSFDAKSVLLTPEMKTAKSAPSEILGTAINGFKVALRVKLTGDVDVQAGDIEVTPIKVEIADVINGLGQALTKTDTDYTRIATALANLKVVGYTVDAYRTNSNLRSRGKLLASDTFKVNYQVPFLSSTTVMGPEVNIGGDNNNLKALADLCVQTGAKQSMYAIKKLLDTEAMLEQATAGGIELNENLAGVGSYFVRPYFKRDAIVVSDSVDSLSSSSRRADIATMFINKIRDAAVLMMLDSNYYVAFSTLRVNEEMILLVGTDVRTKMYITNGESNKIKLTDNLTAYVYATANPRFENKMIMSFATVEGNADNKIDPFNFGNTIWSPTLVTDVKKQTNGANNREVSNVPRFTHIVNLPILHVFAISDYEQALGKISRNIEIVNTVNTNELP